MPRQAKPQNGGNSAVFLNCDLDKQLKKDLVAWVAQEVAQDFIGMMERAIDSGLKFGAGYDAYNECWQASFSKPVTATGKTTTYILIGRGGNLTQAMQALFFKHYVMLDGSWEDLDRKNARRETDWA